jgi:lysyl-tRNA synthetase class 2
MALAPVQRMSNLRQAGIDPYPHRFSITVSVEKFRAAYHHLQNEEIDTKIEILAGRVTAVRISGANLAFIDIEYDNFNVQILARSNNYLQRNNFVRDTANICRGDIIGAMGCATRSRRGELSLLASQITFLAPCLHILPTDRNNIETGVRFGQRYLDLIVNSENRIIIKTIAKVKSFIRGFLDTKDFVEVDTPIISTKVGGANARPFTTHHNDSGKSMYLRIAPELYLKQLIMGGLPKIYEMGKQFRNEGVDSTHNPEFTSIEIYQAFADYTTMMDMTENLISELVYNICGSYQIKFTTDDITHEINFKRPFARINLIEDLQAKAGFTFEPEHLANLSSEQTRLFLVEVCNKNSIECAEPKTTFRLLDKLIGHYLEPLCINPTFIVGHPQIMSPLAKYDQQNPQLTERFELFICGKEYANAYTELNDPVIQEACFATQSADSQKGDPEAQIPDQDYVKALEYGMPPTGGLGIGIDRLLMLLTNQSNIREVITFRPY